MNNKIKAKVLKKEQITPEDSSQTIYTLTVEKPETQEKIEAGGAIAVYPINDAKTVDDLLKLTKLDKNSPITINGNDITLEKALTEELELYRLTRATVHNFLKYIEIQYIREMQDDSEKIQMFLEGKSIVDFLHETPVNNMTIEQLLDILEPIKPRYYFIAAESDTDNTFEIAVTQVNYQYQHQHRKGTCTSYLIDRISAGDDITLSSSANQYFRLPEDHTTDIIMVGAEGGINPFRSFLRHRHTTNAEGKNWLLFSAENEETDFHFKDEIENHLKTGLLDKFDTTYKADKNQSIYVQHKMREHKQEIIDWIDNGSHIYFCADSELKTLILNNALAHIVADCKQLKFQDAENYLDELQETGQYQRITF